jgi:hypothetical protein
MATAIKNARTLVAAGTVNAAAATTRGAVDLRTALGGILTYKITNGAIGPAVQCTAKLLIAHTNAVTPAVGSEGLTWKQYKQVFGGGVGANAVNAFSMTIDKDVMHLEVEFTGNTGQSVTVEAYLSETTSVG